MLSNPKEETEIKVKRTFYCHERKNYSRMKVQSFSICEQMGDH